MCGNSSIPSRNGSSARSAISVSRARRAPGRVGVWVRHRRDGGIAEAKIAALGIRIRRWVSYHGISLNVSPDLGHFAGIVPCGVREHGVTSLADLGIAASMSDVDQSLRHHFQDIFGPIRT